MTTLYSKEEVSDIRIGDIFSTLTNGDFVIIEEAPRRKNSEQRFLIEFLETKYRKDVSKVEIRRGKIKDRWLPSVFGVGSIGDVKMVDHREEYVLWSGMLERCYSDSYKNRRYYGGVTVAERWHRFSNFVEDFQKIARYGTVPGEPNVLDKDFLQKDMPPCVKVYSLETVILTSKTFNSSIINRGWESRSIYGKNRDGEEVFFETWESINDDRFTKKDILRCLKGTLGSHRGFKFSYIN